MEFLNRLLKRKKEAVPIDVALQLAKSDAMRIVSILHSSMYSSSMSWEELLVRFGRTQGLSSDVAKERLIRALNLLKKTQGVNWHGTVGSEITFSRTIPVVI